MTVGIIINPTLPFHTTPSGAKEQSTDLAGSDPLHSRIMGTSSGFSVREAPLPPSRWCWFRWHQLMEILRLGMLDSPIYYREARVLEGRFLYHS
jgi:hypothetical protein